MRSGTADRSNTHNAFCCAAGTMSGGSGYRGIHPCSGEFVQVGTYGANSPVQLLTEYFAEPSSANLASDKNALSSYGA